MMILMNGVVAAETSTPEACVKHPKWFQPICTVLYNTWTQGKNDLYLSGYAWHNRYTYSRERVKSYNEVAWGAGLGKGYVDPDGDWNSLYLMTFLDSHRDLEPIGGYGFIKTAHFSENTRAGIGYTIFLTARSDMFHGAPFPGALPLVSFSYKRFSLFATYIPGALDAGNVLFCFAKYTFN